MNTRDDSEFLLREPLSLSEVSNRSAKFNADGDLLAHHRMEMLLDSIQPKGIKTGMGTVAKPFLKWAGGKQALAGTLTNKFPARFNRFYEPFVGGGSVFLGLANQRAIINDANTWLVDCYRAIRDDYEQVLAKLNVLANDKSEYLRIRAIHPDGLQTAADRAAHLIYLNKTCFRGLFRVNRKGFFNVPYGAYDRRLVDPENLAEVSLALKTVEIRSGDFELALWDVTAEDFIYFDPPYYKLGGYSDFNRYTPDQFRAHDHLRLAALCRELDGRGVKWALSNSKTEFVETIYAGFNFVEVEARREINLKSTERSVTEYLITNYPCAKESREPLTAVA